MLELSEVAGVITVGAELKLTVKQRGLHQTILYSLYVYDTYDRFWLNIAVLSLITVVLSLASSIHMRRERYARKICKYLKPISR